MTASPETITIRELCGRYDGLLLDAYGVLVNQEGALPDAARLIDHLNESRTPYLIVTNDASRLPSTSAERYRALGLGIHEEQVITSGSLLGPYFEQHGLRGARSMVLGPRDSAEYVRRAGGIVVPIGSDIDCAVVVAADDDGYPFLQSLDDCMSALFRLFDSGQTPRLVLPNPDLIYPKGIGTFGYTSGAAALLLETALERRYPGRRLLFDRLGKPHTPMFDEARRRIGRDLSMVMIGDQLETDIAGANSAGIDSALLTTGVSTWTPAGSAIKPTYVVSNLRL